MLSAYITPLIDESDYSAHIRIVSTESFSFAKVIAVKNDYSTGIVEYRKIEGFDSNHIKHFETKVEEFGFDLFLYDFGKSKNRWR